MLLRSNLYGVGEGGQLNESEDVRTRTGTSGLVSRECVCSKTKWKSEGAKSNFIDSCEKLLIQ